jgi:hypothetical protein
MDDYKNKNEIVLKLMMMKVMLNIINVKDEFQFHGLEKKPALPSLTKITLSTIQCLGKFICIFFSFKDFFRF